MNQKEHLGPSQIFDKPHESSTNHQTLEESQKAQPPKPSRRRRQTRGRLLPYEDLRDMAVAKREIVTALRLHRASMEQNIYNHTQQPHQMYSGSSSQATPQPEHKIKSKSRRKSRKYDCNTTINLPDNLDTVSYQSFPYQPQTSQSWPLCASAPPPIPATLNLLLPNQTLGLKLNLQDLDDLDITLLPNNHTPARCYTSTSPSTSNSPILSVAREETLYAGLSQAPSAANPDVEEDLGLHHAVDDEEMAEIRSVGEQHQIAWDDAMNVVTSTGWFNFLNTMEDDTNRFDMEFSPWSNTNDNCFQQLDEHHSGNHSQDHTLPQMDIGEIEEMINEAMDGEWLG
ncbi:hypothetical protein ACET3Z_004147 [Daucus carota]